MKWFFFSDTVMCKFPVAKHVLSELVTAYVHMMFDQEHYPIYLSKVWSDLLYNITFTFHLYIFTLLWIIFKTHIHLHDLLLLKCVWIESLVQILRKFNTNFFTDKIKLTFYFRKFYFSNILFEKMQSSIHIHLYLHINNIHWFLKVYINYILVYMNRFTHSIYLYM